MRFSYTFIFIILALQCPLFACDICGSFMGITPYDNQSQLAFYHRYRIFNGYRNYEQQGSFFPSGAYKTMHGGTSHITDSILKKYSSKDFESYKAYELRAKYFIHKRWEINAILSVSNNKMKEDSVVFNHTGINDHTFYIGYHAIKKIDTFNVQHRLIIGSGFKLPSGNYYAESSNGERLPFLMQPGTGTTDVFFYSNYILGYKKFGLSLNSLFKINGTNYYDERIGNSSSNYLTLFYKIKKNDWIFIPSVQSYYEYTKGLYIKNELQNGTSMNCLLAGPGIEIFNKNFSFSSTVQFNAYENKTPENLSSKGRIIVGLTYNFNQQKYLLQKKRKLI